MGLFWRILVGLLLLLGLVLITMHSGAGKDRETEEQDSMGNATYSGPCPPIGRHAYLFRVYALDQMLDF
ncbi:hypothetical protein [Spirosoma areae]